MRKGRRRHRRCVRSESFRRLQHELGRIGNKIGWAGEARAVKAFECGGLPEWVRGARHATEKEDALGVDVFIRTDVGEIPVQIKTSVLKTEDVSRRRFIDRIPVVYLSLQESDDEVRKAVLSAISPLRQDILNTKKPEKKQ